MDYETVHDFESKPNAPPDIYLLCLEQYETHGQEAVSELARKFGDITWSQCDACDTTTPTDPHHHSYEVCLVCGMLKGDYHGRLSQL